MPVSESKRLAKSARSRRAAKALVKNTPIEVIAQAEGVSAKTISRDLKEPDTRLLLVELAALHGADLKRVFAKALNVAEQALDAKDWETRLRAVRETDRLLRTVTNARLESDTDSAAAKGMIEWEELLIMRARRMATPPAKN